MVTHGGLLPYLAKAAAGSAGPQCGAWSPPHRSSPHQAQSPCQHLFPPFRPLLSSRPPALGWVEPGQNTRQGSGASFYWRSWRTPPDWGGRAEETMWPKGRSVLLNWYCDQGVHTFWVKSTKAECPNLNMTLTPKHSLSPAVKSKWVFFHVKRLGQSHFWGLEQNMDVNTIMAKQICAAAP